MKMSRHTGADMRQALRAVREQLGPDAVILSSRRTAAGVEVTAAIDFDAAELDGTPATAERAAASFAPAEFAQAAAPSTPARDVPTVPAAFAETLAATREAAVAATAHDASATAFSEALSDEIKTLRRILETQVAQLAWNDLSRRAPIHTEILRELTHIGIAQDFAAQVVAKLPPCRDLTQARRLAIATISQELLVTGDRWLESGGRVALIGPTGVGKTTTLAKLAVRWTLRHGPRELALVSADSVRIGAHDPIQALGQMLGAPVYTTDQLDELPGLLAQLARHRFVLIDTPGTSQRDAQLSARLAALAAAGSELETALVIAASTQAGAIEEIVARFAPAKPASCLLTKVDEAASLGGALSVLTRARLPISYLSEGQRVPEDLRPARALELVSNAVRLAQTSGAVADEDLLRRRFGEIAHGLA